VYDPAKAKDVKGSAVKLLTNIEFVNNGTKVFETALVTAVAVNDAERGAVVFQFDVPLAQLKPGTYICQVNVIDDAGGSFMFPRLALRLTAATANATPGVVTTPATK